MEENKYKDALERAKSAIKECGNNLGRIKMIESIFPELGGNEDEKIRKGIMSILEHYKDSGEVVCLYPFVSIEEALAWLEKQGKQTNLPQFTFDDVLALQCCMETVKKVQEDKELYERLQSIHDRLYDTYWLEKQGKQKSSDKAEPKFKVGDWAVNHVGNIRQIIDIKENCYYYIRLECSDTIENPWNSPIDYVDEQWHEWTIQDAKDGDVLASSLSIFIFKRIYMAGKPEAYCAVMDGSFIRCPEGCWTNEQYYPATKDQRELLFKKMAEAGYEWDDEKKETKLLISNGGDFEPELSHKEVTKKSEQKWTDEDEEKFQQMILKKLWRDKEC